ncbi:MAG: hypothetical protein PVJ57_18545 [Phycisphaerae bacterium]|jgi:hypothetical protein
MSAWTIAIGLTAVVACYGCAAPLPEPGQNAAAPKVDATVCIDLSQPVTTDFLGIGVQWASYPWFELSSEDWDKVIRRVEFLRLPFSRVMLDAFWYCRGFDGDGQPVFDWDTPYMRKLHQLLDFCQRNGTTVLLGEWARPSGTELDLHSADPRWTTLVGESVAHFLRDRKYTCIRYYNLINEPHGSWSNITVEDWRAALLNLEREFQRRGLDQQIRIAAPDGDRNLTTRSLRDPDLRHLTGVYDEHWYVYRDEIRRGLLELYAREQLRQIHRADPGKPFILGELGIMDGKTERDQNPDVFRFWYGLAMADAAIQTLRAGVSGVIAWNLDDAMYFLGDGPECMNALTEKLPDDAYERRKIWGMWNILGAEHGQPEEEQLRPWFFAWAVLARTFPAGCEPVEVEATGIPGLRVAAARLATPGAYSIAIVNHDKWPRRLRLHAPAAKDAVTLDVWEYIDADGDDRVDCWPVTVDADGRDIFPRPAGQRRDVRLADGLALDVPAGALLVLTTAAADAPAGSD